MMIPISFFVTGLPKAQPRVKARNLGEHAGVYTPKTADEWKACVAIAAEPHVPFEPLRGPLYVRITVYFPRPAYHFKKDGSLKPNAPVWMTGKPDRDNVDKAILDVLTACGMWRDDSIVCDGPVRKRYANGACGALIEIKEADL